MTLTALPELVDNSTFSKVLALYTRNCEFVLLSEVNKNGFNIVKFWPQLAKQIRNSETESEAEVVKVENGGQSEFLYTKYRISQDTIEAIDDEEEIIPSHFEDVEGLLIIEHKNRDEKNQTRGLVMVDYTRLYLEQSAIVESKLNSFHHWFSHLIIRDSRLAFSCNIQNFDENKTIAILIADFFAKHLKNTTKHDLWDAQGKEYFIERVHYFTSRNLQIESVLPAFPCKSSNTEKVHGLFPDKGEELALRRLIYLTKLIKTIYPAGFKVFIVSDGHVFSDCIGVDDDVVDQYTLKLRELYTKITEGDNSAAGSIGFVSLKDLFFSQLDRDVDEAKMVEHIELNHYTGSKICDDSELSRKLLMVGCDTDAGKLRRDIEQPDHPRLHLYRGFSRFMNEDLSLHPFCKTLSHKAFKKTVSKVAFEMIKRNDAYSNLVELLFPFHLRLSIHAHTNSGPKFGIRLISHDECRTIKALDSNEEPSFEDLLHIPTPWHNCVLKIEGHDKYYLTKSKIIVDAIENGHYQGEWKKSDGIAGIGGHYQLSKN